MRLSQTEIHTFLEVIDARLKQQPITTVHSEPSSAAEVSSDVLSSSAAAAAMDNSGSLGRPPAKLVRSKSPRNTNCGD